MAFGLKIGTTFLDMLPSTQLTLEINTELWVTGEPSIQLGSFTYPFDLPLTVTNRKLLRYPDRIDAYTTPVVIENVVLYIGEGASVGAPYRTGRLFVRKATETTCNVAFIVDGLSNKNNLKFEDIDMGVFNLAPPLDLAAIMDHTTTDPLDQPFIFFPVWNETLYKEYEGTDNITKFSDGYFGSRTMNHYISGWRFDSEADAIRQCNACITPFLRLEYVLDRIADQIGYTLVNDFIGTDEELRRIVIFNNKSINDLELVYKWKIRYNEHLPKDMLITDFLKNIAKWAFCGLFVNHTAKVITIRPYKLVLAAAVRHNWTSRTLDGYEVEQDNVLPKTIKYGTDGSDAYFNNNFVTTAPLIADGAVITDYYEPGGNPNSHSLIDGYYHVIRDNTIMRYDPSRTFLHEQWKKWSHRFAAVEVGGRGESWEIPVIPMWQESGSPSPLAFVYRYCIPRADIPLNIDLNMDTTDEEVSVHNAELSSIRLTIYRGMKDYVGGSGQYPYANSNAYDPATEDETYNHSLHLDGDKGMYNTYARDWIEFMKYKKIVKRKLRLRVADLMNHQEFDKVRIGNMNYFVKSIKITVTSGGLSVADCDLVTIPFATKV